MAGGEQGRAIFAGDVGIAGDDELVCSAVVADQRFGEYRKWGVAARSA